METRFTKQSQLTEQRVRLDRAMRRAGKVRRYVSKAQLKTLRRNQQGIKRR